MNTHCLLAAWAFGPKTTAALVVASTVLLAAVAILWLGFRCRKGLVAWTTDLLNEETKGGK